MSETRQIDPTANVIALVAVHAKHAEDVRTLERRLTDAQIRHVEEIGRLRAEHEEKMAAAESRRIDAVRQIDVLNQSMLAATTKTDAEGIREVVATTAATLTASTAAVTTTVNERLAAIERWMYEGKGKGTGYSAMWGWIAGGILLLLAILKYWNP